MPEYAETMKRLQEAASNDLPVKVAKTEEAFLLQRAQNVDAKEREVCDSPLSFEIVLTASILASCLLVVFSPILYFVLVHCKSLQLYLSESCLIWIPCTVDIKLPLCL